MMSRAAIDAPRMRPEAQVLAERVERQIRNLERKGLVSYDGANELLAVLAPYLGEPAR